MKKIRIGARCSRLALVQVDLVLAELGKVHENCQFEVFEIKTSGDKKQGTPLASKGDKKDWVFEIEQALLNDNIDIAIHSGKDVPSDIEKGTSIFSVLKRASALDVFIGKMQSNGKRISWAEVPSNSLIGTASLRRQASLLSMRPDLRLIEHRGNITTRLEKLDNSLELSGIVLAQAGIERLGFEGLGVKDLKFESFSPLHIMPAMNQGTLCAQIRSSDDDLLGVLKSIQDIETEACFIAERECIELLRADCMSSVSAYAKVENEFLILSSRVLSRNAKEKVEVLEEKIPFRSANYNEAKLLGRAVANKLLSMGAERIIEECRN